MKKTGQQAIVIFAAGILIQIPAIILAKIKGSTAETGGFLEIFAVPIYSAILWFLVKWPVTAIGKWLGVGIHRFKLRIDER